MNKKVLIISLFLTVHSYSLNKQDSEVGPLAEKQHDVVGLLNNPMILALILNTDSNTQETEKLREKLFGQDILVKDKKSARARTIKDLDPAIRHYLCKINFVANPEAGRHAIETFVLAWIGLMSFAGVEFENIECEEAQNLDQLVDQEIAQLG